MSEREIARSSLSFSLFLTSIFFFFAALFPLDVSTIRRIARYCALSMPGPLLHPTTRNESSAWPARSRVSPSSYAPLPRVRPLRTRDVTRLFLCRDRAALVDHDTLIRPDTAAPIFVEIKFQTEIEYQTGCVSVMRAHLARVTARAARVERRYGLSLTGVTPDSKYE